MHHLHFRNHKDLSIIHMHIFSCSLGEVPYFPLEAPGYALSYITMTGPAILISEFCLGGLCSERLSTIALYSEHRCPSLCTYMLNTAALKCIWKHWLDCTFVLKKEDGVFCNALLQSKLLEVFNQILPQLRGAS